MMNNSKIIFQFGRKKKLLFFLDIKEAFRRIDFDYVLESAKLAKHNGCKQFHLVSSANANKNGYFLYTKVKGQIEEAVSDLGFQKCAIYRPA
jgi:uncharacterized protein YbjT (DUF2867 family)